VFEETGRPLRCVWSGKFRIYEYSTSGGRIPARTLTPRSARTESGKGCPSARRPHRHTARPDRATGKSNFRSGGARGWGGWGLTRAGLGSLMQRKVGGMPLPPHLQLPGVHTYNGAMKPHPRIRKALIGIGAMTSLLASTVFVATFRRWSWESAPFTPFDKIAFPKPDAPRFTMRDRLIKIDAGRLTAMWMNIDRPLTAWAPEGSDYQLLIASVHKRRSEEWAARSDVYTCYSKSKSLRTDAPSGFGQLAAGCWYVVLPLVWVRAALGTVTIVGLVLMWVAARRPRPGFCPNCNYDRTGLAAGAVCPECGSKARGGPS